MAATIGAGPAAGCGRGATVTSVAGVVGGIVRAGCAAREGGAACPSCRPAYVSLHPPARSGVWKRLPEIDHLALFRALFALSAVCRGRKGLSIGGSSSSRSVSPPQPSPVSEGADGRAQPRSLCAPPLTDCIMGLRAKSSRESRESREPPGKPLALMYAYAGSKCSML